MAELDPVVELEQANDRFVVGLVSFLDLRSDENDEYSFHRSLSKS